MVNDHFVLWPWRPHELYFNSPHILSFTAESIIKLAWIQFRHLHLGVMLVPWSYFSLDSCVSFLILSPYRTFGNSACLASLGSYVQSTNEFIKGIFYFHYVCMCLLSHFIRVWFFATLWTIACQVPLIQARIRRGLLCPPPGALDPGIEPMSLMSPALAGGVFTTSVTWEALFSLYFFQYWHFVLILS